MAKKTKTPFHIAHKMKEYSYEEGESTLTFWAAYDEDAKLYRKKIEERNANK
jgi:hypothetical protein